jgi:hypothetical protein
MTVLYSDAWLDHWIGSVPDIIGDEEPARTLLNTHVKRGPLNTSMARRAAMHVMMDLFGASARRAADEVGLGRLGAADARRLHRVAHEVARDRPEASTWAVKEARFCDDWRRAFAGGALDDAYDRVSSARYGFR